jgi:hypothetical protein
MVVSKSERGERGVGLENKSWESACAWWGRVKERSKKKIKKKKIEKQYLNKIESELDSPTEFMEKN